MMSIKLIVFSGTHVCVCVCEHRLKNEAPRGFHLTPRIILLGSLFPPTVNLPPLFPYSETTIKGRKKRERELILCSIELDTTRPYTFAK